MGFRYRKSKNFGPFRINISKSGVGWSVGGKGFRYTKKANGGTRTTTSIPGSGMSWVKDYPNSTTSIKQQKEASTTQRHFIEQNNVAPSDDKGISTYLIIVIAFILIFVGFFFI